MNNPDSKDGAVNSGGLLPDQITLTLRREASLRYGENPHQVGARYSIVGEPGWWSTAQQLGGKEMGYVNDYDADAAWRLANSLGDLPTAVVIKHANPCGVAVASNITAAYKSAHLCDPVSAFGGVVAVNRPVTVAMAADLRPVFTEIIIAPAYEDGVLAMWEKKKDMRIFQAEPPSTPVRTYRFIDGGFLVQDPDPVAVDVASWRVVTEIKPTDPQVVDAKLAWQVVARTTSNAIVLVKDLRAVGIGCGQQNRRDAGRLACEKAEGRAEGGVYASDAFFPFADGLDGAIEAKAAVVIQPGGSIRDEEVIARANEAGLCMIFTGERHFKH